MKNRFIGMCAVLALVLLPGVAGAASYYPQQTSYYTTTVSVDAQIQALLREVARLQAELARLRGTAGNGPCYIQGGVQYCYTTGYQNGRDDRATDIQVEYKNDAAYIEIEYADGDDEDFVVAADDDDEVVDYILDLTDIPLQNILAVIDFDGNVDDRNDNDEDISDIDVEIDRDDNEAEARVRYDDGDTDTFDYDTDNKDDIIEELADDLDIDEDEVEDLVDWEYVDSNNNDDDVQDIDVTIDEDDNEAEATVIYDNGDREYYDFNTDNEDDIIEELADELGMDEDDVEDLIDWSYQNGNDNNDNLDDIDRIEIEIENNRAYVRVEWDDGDVSNYTYYTDDEDEIIEELADDLNVDEDDLEDLIDWE
jgi:hypothetical protein